MAQSSIQRFYTAVFLQRMCYLFNMVVIDTQTKYVTNTKHLGLEALTEGSVTSLQCIVYDCTHYQVSPAYYYVASYCSQYFYILSRKSLLPKKQASLIWEAIKPASRFATVRHVQRRWQYQIHMDHDKKSFCFFLSFSAPLQLWMSDSIHVFLSRKQRLSVCITNLFLHLFHCFQQTCSLLLKSENGLLQFAFIGQ